MRVLVAGDFCPQYRVATAFEKDAYSSVLDGVRCITDRMDYSIVNFECPVVIGNAKAINKIGPNLRCTENGVNAIRYAGFDCVTLANNHFYDYGECGVKQTIKTLETNNIDYVGGGMNLNDASRILYKDIGGLRLAIINCCEHEFSIATDTKPGSNPLNPIQQYYTIREARNNSDRVLVIVHGGHEHNQLPSPRMIETYRFFIDAGADAVVNHHQHCYSGYEVYKEKPIFYGLGNFCFDNPQKQVGIWTEGYMVSINFSLEPFIYDIIPYQQCADEPYIKILPKYSFGLRIQELNSIIQNPATLQEKTNKYYSECVNIYSNVFEPIRNRFYLGAKRRGWLPSFISKKRKLQAYNYINCEAHRDKMLFWLEKQK